MDFAKTIESNQRKAIVLLSVIYILVAFCFLLPAALFSGGKLWIMLVVALGGSALYIGIMTLLALPISRKALGGRYPRPEDPKEVALVRSIEELAIAAQMPMPGVLVVDAPDINAFAIGFSPRKAFIGVNRGALDKLSKPELEGILGHEFGHLAGRDTLIKTLAISCLGAVDLILKMLKTTMKIAFGFGAAGAVVGAAARDDDTRQVGWIMALMGVMLALLALSMMLPIIVARWIASVLFYNMSRKQELRADAYSVRFTRNPDGLVRALNKIRLESEQPPARPGLVASLHFSSHLSGDGFMSFLYATHPPVEKRIDALLGQKAQYDTYGRLHGYQSTTQGAFGQPAPLPHATPGTRPVVAQAAVAQEMAPPATPARMVRCPGCQTTIRVQPPAPGSVKAQVQCPSCHRKGEVPWTRPATPPVGATVMTRPAKATPVTVACPKCRTPQTVARVAGQPTTIACQRCRFQGVLKAAA